MASATLFDVSAGDPFSKQQLNHRNLGLLEHRLKKDISEELLNVQHLSDLGIDLSQMSLLSNGNCEEPDFCELMGSTTFDSFYDALEKRPQRWRPSKFFNYDRYDLASSVASFLLDHVWPGPWQETALFRAGYWWTQGVESTSVSHPLLRDYLFQGGSWAMIAILHAFHPSTKGTKTSTLPLVKLWSEKLLQEEYEACMQLRLMNMGQPYPHIGCVLINSHPFENATLLKSEAAAAVDLIRRQLCLKRNSHHGIIPAYVYSFSGAQGRILEAYYDMISGLLRIKMTAALDIDSRASVEEWDDHTRIAENVENMKLMLRWMTNIPKGDTVYKDLTLGEQESIAEKAPATPQRSPLAPRTNLPSAQKAPQPQKKSKIVDENA